MYDAFDTVNHDLLTPRRLEGQCGLRCVVLQWFSSYLSGRTYQVVYGDSTSSVACTSCSVQQITSVVGPGLFTLRILKITPRNMASAFTQFYLQSRHGDTTSAVLRRENCVKEVSYWMSVDRLKLTEHQTELLFARVTSPSGQNS